MGSARGHGRELGCPLAVLAGQRAGLDPVEAYIDGFPGFTPAPDPDRFVPLQDHVVREEGGDREFGHCPGETDSANQGDEEQLFGIRDIEAHGPMEIRADENHNPFSWPGVAFSLALAAAGCALALALPKTAREGIVPLAAAFAEGAALALGVLPVRALAVVR